MAETKQISICILFLFIGTICLGQSIPFDKKHFPEANTQLKEAKKQFEDGSIFFDNGKTFCKYNLEGTYCTEGWSFFEEALPYLLKAQKFNPDNAELNFKIGMCYYASPNKYEALPYLKKAYLLDKTIAPSLEFHYARLSQLSQRWETAYALYEKIIDQDFFETASKDNIGIEDILALKQQCSTAMKREQYQGMQIVPLSKHINSKYPEYTNVILADGNALLFTSKRDSSNEKGNIVIYEDENEKIESIYLSIKQQNLWNASIKLPEPINISGTNSAVLAISNDNREILMRKNGKLFRTSYINETWAVPEPLFNSKKNRETQISASFASTADTIFFTSSNTSVQDNEDIYLAVLDNEKNIVSVSRLPEPVNSEFNETAVFYHQSSQCLFFSSNRPESIGGYDVFSCKKKADGTWSVPIALGLPLNSTEDDLYFSANSNFSNGFISSYRPNTHGNKDIYEILFPNNFEQVLNPTGERRKLTNSNTLDTTKYRQQKLNIKNLNNIAEISIGFRDTVISNICTDSICLISVPAKLPYHISVLSPGKYEWRHQYRAANSEGSLTVQLEDLPKPSLQYERQDSITSVKIAGILSSVDQQAVSAILEVYDSTSQQFLGSTNSNPRTGKFSLNVPTKKTYRIDISAESYINQSSYLAIPNGKNYVEVTDMMFSSDAPILNQYPSANSLKYRYSQQSQFFLSAENFETITDATVEINNAKTRERIVKYALGDKTPVNLNTGIQYSLTVSADGYNKVRYYLNIPASTYKATLGTTIQPHKTSDSKIIDTDTILVLYAPNHSDLGNFQKQYVTEIFKKMVPKKQNIQVLITGHTDSDGKAEYNMELSRKRAQHCAMLVQNLLSLSTENITIDYKGESEPVENNNTEKGKAQNRRVEIIISF